MKQDLRSCKPYPRRLKALSIFSCEYALSHEMTTTFFFFKVFVKFLFHVVEVTASRIAMIERSAENPPSQEIFILKLFSLTLTCVTHLLKSGLLKWFSYFFKAINILNGKVRTGSRGGDEKLSVI